VSSGSSPSKATWRESILRYFSPEVAAVTRVTVVADPDGLLLDDAVGSHLSRSGFDVVPYRDPVEFRFYYESRHRARWDAGAASSLVVSTPCPRQDLTIVPFDVLTLAEANGRVLDVSLASIFPTLDAEVLTELDRADLDAVWVSAQGLGREPLGAKQTRDLVLRSVFKLSAEMVTTEQDLLAQFLRVHFAKRAVPAAFASRFAESLASGGRVGNWPVAELLRSPDAFFRMLQDRWERHLKSIDSSVTLRPGTPDGPASVDFKSPELASVIDNLFLDGRLIPVKVGNAGIYRGRPEAVGVAGVSASGSRGGVTQLLESVRAQLPEPGVPPTKWVRFAQQWAEVVGASDGLSTSDYAAVRDQLDVAQRDVDLRLWEWLVERYGALVNRSYLPSPTMVHHIPHHLAHKRSPGDKVALVIVDGMSLAQWAVVKAAPGPDWTAGLAIEETAVFAWMPTVTSVSRQALLSGQPPMYFESTVYSTGAEERHWKAFWEDRGWRRDRVVLLKHREGEHESSVIDRVRDAADSGQAECLAVVLNTIDRMVHGVGPEGNVLAAAVRQWAENGHVVSLVHCLLERGFSVAITSDHGNVEARGIGRLDLGSIPEDQGLRAVTFPDDHTLEGAMQKLPGTIEWPGIGLPQAMHVLVPQGRGAFTTDGSRTRTHGGASVEELFVPFVKVSKSL
jgi:hypothetical protein